ncbi:MAG TPA: hypothetical protein VIK56_08765 [Rhodoferax sp.]
MIEAAILTAKLIPMPTDSIPKFTEDPAVKLWAAVPDEGKRLILANVWCSHCGRGVTITDYTGSIVGGDLLLSGFCSECSGKVARVVEFGG